MILTVLDILYVLIIKHFFLYQKVLLPVRVTAGYVNYAMIVHILELFIVNSTNMTLEKALKELLIRDPFYGIFMLGLNKRIVSGDHEIQTAAVGLSGLNYTLYVHEDFWKKLTDPQQIALLKHEVNA